MKKKIGVASIILLLILGIGSIFFFKSREQKGIYYEPLDKNTIKQPYNEMAQIAYSSLLYNGKIYTSSTPNILTAEFTCKLNTSDVENSSKEFAAMLSDLQLEEVADVYGNGGSCWSTNKDDIFETKREGKLYKIKGYPKSRLCLCYKSEIRQTANKSLITYTAEIYDCLNDISLARGEDLYKDMLHLEHVENIYARHFDKDDSTATYSKKFVFANHFNESDSTVVDNKENTFSSFFSALCENDFLSEENAPELVSDVEEGQEYLIDNFNNYFLFKDSYGIETRIYISPEGYAVFFSPENTKFIIRLDKQLCNRIISKYF